MTGKLSVRAAVWVAFALAWAVAFLLPYPLSLACCLALVFGWLLALGRGIVGGED